MKLALMVVGALLVVFGLVDLVGSFAGFDLWGALGIGLPELVWKYSAYGEMLIGYLLFKAGTSVAVETAAEEVEGA